MNGILPVEKNLITVQVQFDANASIPRGRSSLHPLAGIESTEKISGNILTLLLTQGFSRTLEYFCTISVFSIA
jgi:hypothetical protein